MFEHVRARTGGNDDIPLRCFEYADRMLHNRTCFEAQAGVEGRLSATGLVAGKFHGQAEAAENADDGLSRLRVERIDKTGDEKLHDRHASILTRNPVFNTERTPFACTCAAGIYVNSVVNEI